MTTLSYLRFRSKVRPTVVADDAPCIEPLNSGELVDGADETYVATYADGGTNIPYMTGISEANSAVRSQQGDAPDPASDPMIDQMGLLRGIGANAPDQNYLWEINTTSPFSGSYGMWIEQLADGSDPTTSDAASLTVTWVEGLDCDDESGQPLRYSARVQAGDSVAIAFHAKHSVASGPADEGRLEGVLTWRDESGSTVGTAPRLSDSYTFENRLTSTAYEQWTWSGVAPANAYYAQVEVTMDLTGGTSSFLQGYMDALTITVS